MELFAAGDEEQLEVIKRWIDDSDIFMLLLGKRYGSIEPRSGKSYTQVEYEYALGEGVRPAKPHFALLLSDAAAQAKLKQGTPAADVYEQDHREKLQRFEGLVRSRMCSDVGDANDIKLRVVLSLAFSSYFYQTRNRGAGTALDVWGGRDPDRAASPGRSRF